MKFERDGAVAQHAVSLPVRGAWIEISSTRARKPDPPQSLPVRGAWIEIAAVPSSALPALSLPVRGAWIEIAMAMQVLEKQRRRSPCGERGLK